MVVEYIDEIHTYLADGVIIPSVTQVVGWKLGKDYSNVPSQVLNAKAEYGTQVHRLIERWESGMTEKELSLMRIDPIQKVAVKNYAKLKKKYLFEVKSMEQIVANNRCAGRYDILTTEGELIDIKTTYRLDEEYLSWQLGMYYWLMDKEKPIGYAMWLPKQTEPKFKLIHVKSNKECEELIDAFINSNG